MMAYGRFLHGFLCMVFAIRGSASNTNGVYDSIVYLDVYYFLYLCNNGKQLSIP